MNTPPAITDPVYFNQLLIAFRDSENQTINIAGLERIGFNKEDQRFHEHMTALFQFEYLESETPDQPNGGFPAQVGATRSISAASMTKYGYYQSNYGNEWLWKDVAMNLTDTGRSYLDMF